MYIFINLNGYNMTDKDRITAHSLKKSGAINGNQRNSSTTNNESY
mgnify:CR=1 FL=1|jgi:hypothetical protein